MDIFKDRQFVLHKVEVALNITIVDRFVLANNPKLRLYNAIVFIVLFTHTINL